jgi:hypothetical protein
MGAVARARRRGRRKRRRLGVRAKPATEPQSLNKPYECEDKAKSSCQSKDFTDLIPEPLRAAAIKFHLASRVGWPLNQASSYPRRFGAAADADERASNSVA